MVVQNILKLIKKEFSSLGGVEVTLPIATNADLFKQAGRDTFLAKRNIPLELQTEENQFVLPNGYEEAFTALVKDVGVSIAEYPFFLYQTQKVFQSNMEGADKDKTFLEFLRCDGVSFHRSATEMNNFFPKLFKRIANVFEKCGVETIAAESDVGMTAANKGYSFFFPWDHTTSVLLKKGKKAVALCPSCGYKSCEFVGVSVPPLIEEEVKPMEEKPLEGISSEEFAKQEGISPDRIGIAYFLENEGKPIILFTRQPSVLSHSKVRWRLGHNTTALSEELREKFNIDTLNRTPFNREEGVTIMFDKTLFNTSNSVFFSFSKDTAYVNVHNGRDFKVDQVIEAIGIGDNDNCLVCGETLKKVDTLEIASLYKLMDYYSLALDLSFPDRAGEPRYPTSVSSQIVFSRLLVAIAASNHDDNGIIWPVCIAPYDVFLMGTGKAKTVETEVNRLEKLLGENRVLLDDRHETQSHKKKAANLLGIPVRIIVSVDNLAHGVVEMSNRKSGEVKLVTLDDVESQVTEWTHPL